MENISRADRIPSPLDEPRLDTRTSGLFLAAIFLVSFSLLALEISLTRVLSVMFAYHYVFVVLSLALLGLGLGAVFAQRLFRAPALGGHFRFLSIIVGLLALSIPLSLLATRLIAEATTVGILYYVPVLFLPFFFGGLLLAVVFRLFPSRSAWLYGADLLGAAGGAVGVVLVLNAFGGARTAAFTGVIALAAASLLALIASGYNARRLMTSAAGVLAIISLFSIGLAAAGGGDVPLGKTPDKEINSLLNEPSLGAEIVETRSSAFGRTDLVALRNQPEQMAFFVDGTAGTPMYQLDSDIQTAGETVRGLKTTFPAYLSLANLRPEQKNSALVIGPGGGRDILLALLAGISKITAVEVNPDLADLARRYSAYNGGIYQRRDVSLVVDEGRNFLRRQQEKYDVILLSLPITKTSRSVEGFALTENFLFTVESINDYMERLSDEGQMVVVAHTPAEILRLLSISLAALERQGVDNETAMQRIYVIGWHHYPVFVLKKQPFGANDLVPVHRSIHELGYDPSRSFIPTIKAGSCTPHESGERFDECGMLDPVLTALNRGEVSLAQLTDVLKDEGFDMRPVTDDSPFFYKSSEGIPLPVALIFWLAVITLLIIVLVPLLERNKAFLEGEVVSEGHTAAKLKFVIFFTMLGMGFMLVEISIFQKFTLFLGQPVLSLAALLSSLLVGGGLGSLSSSRFAARPARFLSIVSAAIAAVLVAYTFVLPVIFRQLMGADLAIRLLVAVAAIIPLGFLMGFPFPSGIRLLKESGMEDRIPWMWGVNGVSSVVGSAVTLILAMTYGFTAALLLGAACYLAALVMPLTLRAKKSPTELPAQAEGPV